MQYLFFIFIFCIDCGNPSKGPNMVVNKTGTTFNQTAFYVCTSGYHTSNMTEAICNENGNWSIQPPKCRGMFMLFSALLFSYCSLIKLKILNWFKGAHMCFLYHCVKIKAY